MSHVETLNRLHVHYLHTDKESLIKTGKQLAALATRYPESDFVQGTLKDARKVYARRFGKAAAPAIDAETQIMLDEEAANMGATAPAPAADATYTVAVSETEWFTVKLETMATGTFEGKRIASFLSGPDNETDFQGFAFVNPNGTVAVWKRFRSEGYTKFIEALNMVLGYPAMSDEFRLAYAMKSGRCARCNRKLTVPASLNRGLGPDCAERMGLI